jgi:hypothetical protein
MNDKPIQKMSMTVNLIWAALFFSTFVYVILAFVLSRSGWKPVGDPALGQVLMGIFMALSLIEVMFVSWLKKKSFTEELTSITSVDSQKKFIVSRSVVLFALSEVPAILGLVTFFLTGNFMMLLAFWGISFISFLIAKPAHQVLDQVDRV